ncbi:hypothetical protein [Flavobacterium sp.]|jgi:hypothetical protein|uniref:hypothetical protein n=1 Tax=Flavobacterium sp. TaxID=239 RepID=UPI0037BF6A51
MTPEKKVKDKVVKLLKEHDAYYFYPVTGGYGASGVPDIVVCMGGKFIGIECKADGGKATALQMKNLTSIAKNGGYAVLVDETGIGSLKMMLIEISAGRGTAFAGIVFDLLKGSKDEDCND